jgi:hypothetical protein
MRALLLQERTRKVLITLFCVVCVAASQLVVFPQKTNAASAICAPYDCPAAAAIIANFHEQGETAILNTIPPQFNNLRDYITDTFFKQTFLPALMRFSEQMSALGMNQIFLVGTHLDVIHQLQTDRLFQELRFQAWKDYMPSEDFCWFGSSARSLAPSEQIGRYNAAVLNTRHLARQLGNKNVTGAESRAQDKATRWERFIHRYCDPQDNAWTRDEPGTGLQMACGAQGGGNTKLANLDIDYTRMIDEPRSINLAFFREDLSPPMIQNSPNPNEQDVLALSSNLYGHNVLSRDINAQYLDQKSAQDLYMALRAIAAKRGVAQNSFNAIAGMKSYGSSDLPVDVHGKKPKTRAFLGAVLAELGVKDENGDGDNADEIFEIIGEDPSYYAQLEILAKKIYETSNFFSNLYDTPTNVARKGVAMKAIELMLDRAIYESETRQELATSVLLSSRLRNAAKETSKNMQNLDTGG